MTAYESRLSAVLLSRGSHWSPNAASPPYLVADPLHPWPASGATARCVFYSTTGAQLLSVDGTVTAQEIAFSADAADVDTVPAGAKFEIFLDVDGKSHQIRYGEVMRREAQFLNAPAAGTGSSALQYSDTFPTLGVKSSWQRVAGNTVVFDNSGSSLAHGIGAQQVLPLTGNAISAVRWFAPLNTDSVRVSVNLLNRHDNPLVAAKTRVIVCSDIRMTSYLAVQFEENAHTIRFATGNGDSATVTLQGTSISNTVADNDNYTIAYQYSTKTISVYKGTSTSPLGSWTDSGNVVPHGPGYRYAGLAFWNGGSTHGLQVSYWSAKDDV